MRFNQLNSTDNSRPGRKKSLLKKYFEVFVNRLLKSEAEVNMSFYFIFKRQDQIFRTMALVNILHTGTIPQLLCSFTGISLFCFSPFINVQNLFSLVIRICRFIVVLLLLSSPSVHRVIVWNRIVKTERGFLPACHLSAVNNSICSEKFTCDIWYRIVL
jgi:hypothetical protein